MYIAIQKQKLFLYLRSTNHYGFWEGDQQINEFQHFMATIRIREIHLKSRRDQNRNDSHPVDTDVSEANFNPIKSRTQFRVFFLVFVG